MANNLTENRTAVDCPTDQAIHSKPENTHQQLEPEFDLPNVTNRLQNLLKVSALHPDPKPDNETYEKKSNETWLQYKARLVGILRSLKDGEAVDEL